MVIMSLKIIRRFYLSVKGTAFKYIKPDLGFISNVPIATFFSDGAFEIDSCFVILD